MYDSLFADATNEISALQGDVKDKSDEAEHNLEILHDALERESKLTPQ